MGGNILFIGQSSLAGALRSLGFGVMTVHHTPNADCVCDHPLNFADLLSKISPFKPDYLFYCDDGNLPLLIDPHNSPCPSVYYSVDTYCNPWHIPCSRGFDMTLVAQKDFLPIFEDEEARWFPLFCNLAEGSQSFEPRDIPVAFVGTIGHKNNRARGPFLRQFRRLQPLFIGSGNYYPIFARSRIVLNQTAFGEVNYRCFETIACGATLLMENCGNGLSELFTPGEDILPTYDRGDYRQAAQIAGSYLQRPAEIERIAKNGLRTLAERHTALERAKTLAGYMRDLSANRSQLRRLVNPLAASQSVKTAFAMLASELTRPAFSHFRNYFLKLA